jgi:phosphatidylserine decarboxylase
MSAGFSAILERAKVDLLRWAPKASYSHLVGWAADRKVPRWLRQPVYRRLAEHFHMDLAEAETTALDAYEHFNDLFTRRLRSGARPVAEARDAVVSPCDGVVVECGVAHRGRMVQAKGRDYTIEGLLCDAHEANRFEGGAYATIYLCPADYHRVHAPVGGAITGARHIHGALFPVNPPSVRHVAGLVTINERVATYLAFSVAELAAGGPGSSGDDRGAGAPQGRCAVVMVAATGVGNMSLAYAPAFRASARRGHATDLGLCVPGGLPRPLRKGDEVGTFNLGSTVILLFTPGSVILDVEKGATVRVGERIGSIPGLASAVLKGALDERGNETEGREPA